MKERPYHDGPWMSKKLQSYKKKIKKVIISRNVKVIHKEGLNSRLQFLNIKQQSFLNFKITKIKWRGFQDFTLLDFTFEDLYSIKNYYLILIVWKGQRKGKISRKPYQKKQVFFKDRQCAWIPIPPVKDVMESGYLQQKMHLLIISKNSQLPVFHKVITL